MSLDKMAYRPGFAARQHRSNMSSLDGDLCPDDGNNPLYSGIVAHSRVFREEGIQRKSLLTDFAVTFLDENRRSGIPEHRSNIFSYSPATYNAATGTT